MAGTQEAGGLLEQAGGRGVVSGQEQEAAPKLTTCPGHLPVRAGHGKEKLLWSKAAVPPGGYRGVSAVQPVLG